jgi:hypothetical protein
LSVPEDRVDALADPRQHRAAARLVLARRPEDRCADLLGDPGFEVAAGVALVADDQLAAMQPDLKQPQRDVALLLIGRGEDRRARVPSAAQSRCSRIPQNQREWLRL